MLAISELLGLGTMRICRLSLLRRRLSNVVLDLTSHGREGRLDILALLSRSLEEADSVVVGHLLALLE